MDYKKEKFNEKRRAFLKGFLKFFLLFSTSIFTFLGLLVLKPSKIKRKEYVYFEIEEVKIPKESVKRVDIRVEGIQKSLKVYLVNEGDSIIALSPVCTHLGCHVNFDRESKEFICPCHGGRYDIKGRVLKGPPKESLRRFPVKIEDKKVLVGIMI